MMLKNIDSIVNLLNILEENESNHHFHFDSSLLRSSSQVKWALCVERYEHTKPKHAKVHTNEQMASVCRLGATLCAWWHVGMGYMGETHHPFVCRGNCGYGLY